jgi:hypothetical protein
MGEEVAGRALADRADVIDDHFHNYEEVYGMAAVPTATHFGDRESLTPYLVTSGIGVFGAEVGLLGTGDTPFRTGSIFYDIRRVSIQDASVATAFILRVLWKTPAQTVAQAITALQYSDTVIQQLVATGNNKPQDLWNVRVPCGYASYAMVKNAAAANVHIFALVHEYPSQSP